MEHDIIFFLIFFYSGTLTSKICYVIVYMTNSNQMSSNLFQPNPLNHD